MNEIETRNVFTCQTFQRCALYEICIGADCISILPTFTHSLYIMGLHDVMQLAVCLQFRNTARLPPVMQNWWDIVEHSNGTCAFTISNLKFQNLGSAYLQLQDSDIANCST